MEPDTSTREASPSPSLSLSTPTSKTVLLRNTFDAVRKLSTISNRIAEINTSSLSGCMDVLVVKQSDGELKGSPFYVRFGRLKAFRPHRKWVRLYVNGKELDLKMRLTKQGNGYFVRGEIDWNDESSETSSEDSSPEGDLSEDVLANDFPIRLSSDELLSLNLHPGINEIAYEIMTNGSNRQGSRKTARLFLWDSNSTIVVSDIDGTVTKSDALGHILPALGRDWSHPGIAQLYSTISNNGYKIVYLSSRGLSQADITRRYILEVKQDDYKLPDGPIILSPDSLLTALKREVILRKPEEFKVPVLQSLKSMFNSSNGRIPIHAGFGNRINDSQAYRSIGIPPNLIFQVDNLGSIELPFPGHPKLSYGKLQEQVDTLFPPIGTELKEFNQAAEDS
ncbi:Lipin/Ned1/Smp2-domain-containing protein [Paraphysoderma sedebokerense]|nr:Lipin/Ned1/Smp2-domain-containing protein [Paraphysoderma sedebokerense]